MAQYEIDLSTKYATAFRRQLVCVGSQGIATWSCDSMSTRRSLFR
jgi:hypothetical protein